jgi:hypothetical protein
VSSVTEPSATWYDPLQEKDEIRILRLEPGDKASRVVCDLIHVKLSENPVYEALSYQWGLENVMRKSKVGPGMCERISSTLLAT